MKEIEGVFGGKIKEFQNKYCKIIIGEDKIFLVPIGDKSKLQIEGTAIKDLINEVKTMNEDTIDCIVKDTGMSPNGLHGVNTKGLCGRFQGNKVFCDNTLSFGEVEMR